MVPYIAVAVTAAARAKMVWAFAGCEHTSQERHRVWVGLRC